MTKHLLKKGFEFKELEAAGLSKMGKRGPIDQFQRRLLWPIKNLSGDVIGFGARKLFDDDKMGKYMNTPETLLYKKSKVLFGLDSAKKAIAAGHQAVVVEGYTDVMAMHAAGIDTAVASCGTAFGEEHLQMLRRLMLDDNYFRGELIYTFDGDEAGQKAAMRAFEGDQKFTGQSFVSVAPNGMDPCDLRLERGDAAVRDLVARRIPMFEFVIQSIISEYTLDTVEGRLAALRRAVPIVADIRDKTLQSEYARLLSGWVGWSDPSEVLRQVHEEARRPKRDKKPVRAKRFDQPLEDQSLRPTMALPNPRNPVLWQERESLKIALQYPELAGSYFDGLPTDSFTNPAYRMVRDAISAAGGCERALDGTDWLPAVSENMTDILGTSLVSELAMEPIEVEAQDLESYTDGVLSRLQETRVGNQIAILKGQLQRMRPSEDEQAYNSLFSDLVALEQARRELLARAFRG